MKTKLSIKVQFAVDLVDQNTGKTLMTKNHLSVIIQPHDTEDTQDQELQLICQKVGEENVRNDIRRDRDLFERVRGHKWGFAARIVNRSFLSFGSNKA